MKFVAVRGDSPTDLQEELIELLSRQMEFLGEDVLRSQITSSVQNALRPETRAHAFLAITDDGATAGMIFLNICSGIQAGGDYIWMNEIFVQPDFRRKGVGTFLLKETMQWALKNDCRYITAVTSDLNLAAQGLVKKFGFEVGSNRWLEKRL